MTPEALRARRQAAGLTQSQLASHLGVSPNTVARWERGERPIPPRLVQLGFEVLDLHAEPRNS